MENNTELTRYQILLQHRQHQNKLLWSRVQTLYLVQAAVLSGSYTVSDKWYGWAILVLGFILTSLIGLLCSYDWRSSKVNTDEFFNLGDELKIRWSEKNTGIRKYLPGNRILKYTMILFAWLDVELGFYYFWKWHPEEQLSKITVIIFIVIILIILTIYFWRFWEETPNTLHINQSQPSRIAE